MMTFNNTLIYNNTMIDPKPGWWTAERMDYCDKSDKRNGKKAARKFLLMFVSMFA